MKSVIIIGGGLAGLSAAVNLSEKGFEITLIESSPQLGGRSKSFFLNEWNSFLDNGQHLLIKGYEKTLELIKRVGAEKNFEFQNEFAITFRDRFNSEWKFQISNFPDTILAFLMFRNLSINEKFQLLKFFIQLKQINPKYFSEIDALSFLRKVKQSENLINNFWKLIVESALNTPLEKASTEIFLSVLIKMFVEDRTNSFFVIPKKSLHESLINPIENYLTQKGVRIIRNRSVEKINYQNDYVIDVVSRDQSLQADFYIIAVHPAVVNKLIAEYKIDLSYQSIINLHLKIYPKELKNKFFALWNSEIHWIFFHENYLTAVRSSADQFSKLSNEEIFETFVNELIDFFPELNDDLKELLSRGKDYIVIREKRATFISDTTSTKIRPSTITKYKNVFLAGDYVDTGLPSTIESAVVSGMLAAEKVCDAISKNETIS